MLGAIVGDIVGSQFEHSNYLSKSFELFSPECSFSDDTVLTLAVCQALLETETKPELLPQAAERHLANFANRYWKLSYGGQFNRRRLSSDHCFARRDHPLRRARQAPQLRVFRVSCGRPSCEGPHADSDCRRRLGLQLKPVVL